VIGRFVRLVLMLLALFGPAFARPAKVHACAGCRNPSMPVTRGNEGPLHAGALHVGATLSGTTVHVVHEAGCADLGDCTEVPLQPLYLHDQHLYPVELRASVEYGLHALLGVEAQLPFRAVGTTIDFMTPTGEAYEPLDADVHHRDETIAGVADPWLLLRVGGRVGDVWLAARAGLTLPLGSTEEDPFALGDRGLRHQHIQLGSGTLDPVLVLEANAPIDTFRLRGFVQGKLSLYENTHGYRAPARLDVGTSIGHALIGDLAGSVGLDASHETPERWSGVIRQDGNLGRTELLAALGLAYTAGAGVLTLDARFPLVRHIVKGSEEPGTLSSPVMLSLGFAYVFGPPAEQAFEH
jgi:hypothetical protein